MQNINEESKKKVLAGVALTGLAAAAYIIYKKLSQQENENENENDDCCEKDCQKDVKQTEEKMVEEKTEEVAKEIKKESFNIEQTLELAVSQFKKTLVPGTEIMDMDCLKQIMSASAKLSEADFIVLTQSNRVQRRAIKGDSSQFMTYIDLLSEYTEEMQNLMVKHQQIFTSQLKIDDSELELCMNYYMQKGFMQQIYMLGAQQSVLLKNSLPSNLEVTSELAVDIFQYQLDYIKTNPQIIESIAQRLMENPMAQQSQEAQMEMMQRVPALLNLVISDEAHEAYGVEEEDLVKFLQNPLNLQDPKLQRVMAQLQQVVQSIMGQGGMM